MTDEVDLGSGEPEPAQEGKKYLPTDDEHQGGPQQALQSAVEVACVPAARAVVRRQTVRLANPPATKKTGITCSTQVRDCMPASR
ncbi:MAG TPA: hypothetical protein VK585_01885 [Jiangellaceae bacterium]|nr:hypothetical protein [Jiangellaceae bacterium]